MYFSPNFYRVELDIPYGSVNTKEERQALKTTKAEIKKSCPDFEREFRAKLPAQKALKVIQKAHPDKKFAIREGFHISF